MTSGAQFGATDLRPWNLQILRATSFYSQHKTTLDLPRGAGYWLWKPFIILETLRQMNEGDCLVYSDAGMEIVDDLTPLLRIASERCSPILFSGHGTCREWTKRDCFFFMNADEPQYHEAQMLDASFIVCAKTPETSAFVTEWLEFCQDQRILTDAPNTCGLPNLPGFVDHRHDQSVLSLLTKRNSWELFRHPSQFGNQSKLPEYRIEGEWLSTPYSEAPLLNSPYGTLLNHHRGVRPRVNYSIDASGKTVVSLDIPTSLWLEKVRKRPG